MKLPFMCSLTDAPLTIIILMIFIHLFLFVFLVCFTSCCSKVSFHLFISSRTFREHLGNIREISMSDLNLLICFIFFEVQTFKVLLLKPGGKTHHALCGGACTHVQVHV